jgi:predicted RNA-binding Zn ribbon-like protein
MMLVMKNTTTATAPDRLELVLEFVNSRDIRGESDDLATADEAAAWLAAHDLDLGGELLAEAETVRLAEVREALRELMLAANEGERPPAAAIEALNAQSADARIGLRFSADGADLVTSCAGADRVIASLLSIVHESMRDGTWQRVKACAADDCHWAFYDHSRNRSGTWCSMEECGNRAKARSFRERRRAETTR